MQKRFLQSAQGTSRATRGEATDAPDPTDAITRTLLDRGPLTSDALFAVLLDEHGLPEDRAREALAGCVRAGRVGVVVEDRVARWRAR